MEDSLLDSEEEGASREPNRGKNLVQRPHVRKVALASQVRGQRGLSSTVEHEQLHEDIQDIGFVTRIEVTKECLPVSNRMID